MRVSPSIWLLFLALLIFPMGSGWAQVDRVGRLIQILETSTNYKVRLQAVITLGTLKNKRAVPTLIGALSDENYSVRGVAAASLAQIDDQRVLPELKRLLKNEKNSFVRSQVERAIRTISNRQHEESPDAGGKKYYITLGKLANKSGRMGSVFSKVLGEALLKEFARETGITTDVGGSRQLTNDELHRRRMQGYIVDGSILSLTRQKSAEGLEFSCNIKISLATFPGNSIKVFYSGGASTAVPDRPMKPEYEERLFKEVLEGAAQGAKEHIMQSFLRPKLGRAP